MPFGVGATASSTVNMYEANPGWLGCRLRTTMIKALFLEVPIFGICFDVFLTGLLRICAVLLLNEQREVVMKVYGADTTPLQYTFYGAPCC